ncbi:MAG TPA: hypothetical protein VNG31_04555 [Candidatus Baltobacteraceae bacterium]|nr:hypothetical protein [Candidatus Baltobacteraceae bacterium]
MANNLPHYPMPIVGRDREIADVAAALSASSVVTLAGFGGIGKTRLAVEVAGKLEAARDGTWFVDLAPIADGDLVPGSIAAAVGVELAANQDPVEALIAALRGKHMLILLDNCEHVVAKTAGIVDGLIRSCPDVRVLTTSREPLGVAGEAVYRLGPLDGDSAIELFVALAHGADPHFSAGGRNAAVLRDICKRLDGIALAITLAAASVRVMPLGQLRARLDGRFRLLVAANRTTLPRHQTMQALIDWSYDLLDETERTVLRRLSVFSGGFGAEAAASVTADASVGQPEVERALGSLAEKSMIAYDAGSQRYAMLESIRQYALERLREFEEEEATRRAFAGYFAERAATARASFGEGSEERWLGAYAPDLDNFRGALDWARNADVELAAAIATDLGDFWEFENLAGEGLRRCEVILAALVHPDDPHALPLLLAAARLSLAVRVYRRSLELAQRARSLAERAKDPAALAEARCIAGRSCYLLGIDPQRALWDLRDALDYIRTRGKPFHVARTLRDYASALAQTEPEEGRKLLLEALALAESLDWPRLTVHVKINVAEREFRSGNVIAAAQRARDVIEQLRKRRSSLQLGHALTNLAAYLVVNHDYDEAFDAAREAVSIGLQHDMQNYVALPLQSAALALASRGDAMAAAGLLGYVDAFYDRFSMRRELTEQIVLQQLMQRLHEQLDEVTLKHEIGAGRSLSDDAACALAFEVKDPVIAREAT